MTPEVLEGAPRVGTKNGKGPLDLSRVFVARLSSYFSASAAVRQSTWPDGSIRPRAEVRSRYANPALIDHRIEVVKAADIAKIQVDTALKTQVIQCVNWHQTNWAGAVRRLNRTK